MTEKLKGQRARDSRTRWKQNPEAVQANILRVARQEFAKNGLSGARVDEIAARTETSKRMIYYYFGDKEGLYRRVLEEAYREVRAGEQDLDLEDLEPEDALRRLVQFTFDHHSRNPAFIRLVMIENIHDGAYLKQSKTIRELNRGAIQHLERVLDRGRRSGVFRPDADPLVVHWQISAFSFFNVSNAATFPVIFGDRLAKPRGQKLLRHWVAEAVLRSVVSAPETPHVMSSVS
ncbi:MAG TPA: TetR/AcrR family transcriptional regulator [Kiloniellales bacterium]|nr:TetR/AcrR family transcriptional regulator [Kiloniellales bacterium]